MLHVSTLEQFDIQLADFLTMLSALGLLLMLVPAVLLTPGVAAVTESLTFQKHKAFYRKCARQLSQVPFGMGLMLFTILGTASMIALMQFRPELMEPDQFWRPLAVIAAPIAAMFLLTLYVTTWTRLKKLKWLHNLLGYLAALACLAVLFLAFLFLVSLQRPIELDMLLFKPGELVGTLWNEYLSSPPLWLLTVYLVFLGIASGSGLSQLWLIMRRYKDDYGRDYYNFAMRYCARLALVFTFFSTAAAGALFWSLWQSMPSVFLQPQDRGVLLVAFGLPISCCILWLCILKSDTPMRHKPGAFFACLFLFISLCAQTLFYLSTFPML